jgi:hypothetical protein
MKRVAMTTSDEMIHQHLIEGSGGKASKPAGSNPEEVIPLGSEEELARF